jgi:RNA polymerase sigma factor (sigma-70 family)
VRAGDDRAFEQLYLRYQKRIGAYVYGMVHDHGRAEDITQEVFMSALRRMRATDGRIVFKPWVYEIAKNACIDAFRRSRRAEEISYDADDAGERLQLVSNGPSPDAAVDTRMSLDHLRGAFGGLSDAHHQILVMRELEGLSYRQIGERLGMSRPSVESTLFRARRRLSEEYDELVSGERCQRIQAIIAGATDGHVGTRDERKMARHVSHCQPCRRAALVAGFDPDALVPKRTVREKLAALLPLPAFLKRRIAGPDAADPGSMWMAAAHYVEPAGGGWMKLAATASAVLVAGLGANAVRSRGDDKPATGAGPAAGAPVRSASKTNPGKAGHVSSGSTAARQGSPHGSAPGATTTGGGGSTTSGAGGLPSAGSAPGSTGSTGASASSGGIPTDPIKDAARTATGAAGAAGAAGTQVAVPEVQVPTAQLPTVQAPTIRVPHVSGAPPIVNKTVDTVNGAVAGATGAANTGVAKATGTVNGAVAGATGTVNSAAGQATGSVSGTAGAATQAAGGTVGNVTGATGNVLGGG